MRAKLVALACTVPAGDADGPRGERWTHRELADIRFLDTNTGKVLTA